jgi:hypothetical protein
MEANNILKLDGYKALLKELGPVRAERFISLIQQETFDYTEWQKKLWIDKNIEEISNKAAEHQKHSQ